MGRLACRSGGGNEQEKPESFAAMLKRLSSDNLKKLSKLVSAEESRRDDEGNEYSDMSDAEFNRTVAAALDQSAKDSKSKKEEAKTND
jgi:hypothetical protein